MRTLKGFCVLLLLLGGLLVLLSCAPGIRLNTQGGQGSGLAGNYTVIYYGCNFFNDLETIAFLVREGSGYDFEPYAPDFKYGVKKGLSAEEALETAMKFVSCNAAFGRAQVSSVLAPNGEMLAQEVRPLYQSFAYGVDDILDVYYWLKDRKVIIYVRLVPSIDMMLQGGGRNREQ